MSDNNERLKVLAAGILSLILLLGIARFAYTPLLPIMQKSAGLGVSEAGWLATINYLGYFCGAIIASLISSLVIKDYLYRIGLIVAVLSTVGMGLTDNFWLWSTLRFFAGLSSAAGLLLGSGLILNWLIRHDFRSELGIHFSGLGLGIALCAVVVELMSHHLEWHQQWYALTVFGVMLMIPAWIWLPPPDSSQVTRGGQSMADNPPGKSFLTIFMFAYFCAGVGYVVSATFIVSIVEQLPGMTGRGSWAFMIVGLAAAPACIFWDLVSRRLGDLNALAICYVLQIVGIILPVFNPGLTTTVLGALLFGATFIGIVSLVLTMAGRYYPTRPAKMMGKMTVSYGVAQILAPAIIGILAEITGGYAIGLYIASFMMLLGTLLILWLKKIERIEQEGLAEVV